MMTIIDKHGKAIQITDLDLAILQADDYRHYRHADPEFAELDEKLKAYWQDMYEKLVQLKNINNP